MPKKTLYRRARSTLNRNLKLLRMLRENKRKFNMAFSSRLLSHKAKQLSFFPNQKVTGF